MKTFDEWLKQATRGLTSGSADRVCAENQHHYDSALAAAAPQRADPAESFAISVVGDADTANFCYRRALLSDGIKYSSAGRAPKGLHSLASVVSLLVSGCRLGLRSRQRTPGHRLGSSRTAASRAGLGSEASQ